jgi:hypothetical protein
MVRVVFVAIAMWAIALSDVSAFGGTDTESTAILDQNTASDYRIEERALSDLSGGMTAFVLSSAQNQADIHFNLPPNINTEEAWLKLAARPASDTSDGRIQVSVNGGDPITITPEPRALEARFALFSSDLRPGRNTLAITFSAATSSAGWIVDARRSQLRLSLNEVRPIATLEELETVLAADFAAPRRIALITEVSRQRATIEGLVAQGVSLRAHAVPLFTDQIEQADLIIRIAENSRLDDNDRVELVNRSSSSGPEIAFSNTALPRLIITGRNIDEAAAASRLFAARSFVGYDQSFVAADAVSAQHLGQAMPRGDRQMTAQTADLRTFSTSGLPFSADQGSRTAVQFTSQDPADRHGALSVLARAALVSGEAWLYAWYGEAHDVVPADHNLLAIGPSTGSNSAISRNAPAELHAAMRAAERSRGQRGLMRLAAAAYAADNPPTEPLVNLGVASLFANQDQPGRWIATMTAPDVASFEAAGRSLARSDLWHSLEGRAAIWSERGVTAYDFSVTAPTLLERSREFAADHTRDAAFVLFGVAFIILLRGIRRRRRVHAT